MSNADGESLQSNGELASIVSQSLSWRDFPDWREYRAACRATARSVKRAAPGAVA